MPRNMAIGVRCAQVMRVALFDVIETRTHDGYEYSLRRVMRVIERSIDKCGQQLRWFNGNGHLS